MKAKIEALKARFENELAAAKTADALEALRVAYLGKKGPVADLMGELRNVPKEEKAEAGQLNNALKTALADSLAVRRN